jgi:hypothetical protein
MKERTVRNINAAGLAAISADDSASRYGHRSHLNVCVKYTCPETYQPCNIMFAMVELEGWAAADLYHKVMEVLRGWGVNLEGGLVAFSSDGASAFSSAGEGVAGYLLREVNAALIHVHCVAHRVNLAMKDLASCPRLQAIITNLDQCIKLANSVFNRSPKRWHEYSAVAELMGSMSKTFKVFVASRWAAAGRRLGRLP